MQLMVLFFILFVTPNVSVADGAVDFFDKLVNPERRCLHVARANFLAWSETNTPILNALQPNDFYQREIVMRNLVDTLQNNSVANCPANVKSSWSMLLNSSNMLLNVFKETNEYLTQVSKGVKHPSDRYIQHLESRSKAVGATLTPSLLSLCDALSINC